MADRVIPARGGGTAPLETLTNMSEPLLKMQLSRDRRRQSRRNPAAFPE
jgi:hypothetical protein